MNVLVLFIRSIILYHFIENCSGQKNNKPLLCIKWPFKKSVARRKMLVALILGYLQAACALPFWYVMEKLEQRSNQYIDFFSQNLAKGLAQRT